MTIICRLRKPCNAPVFSKRHLPISKCRNNLISVSDRSLLFLEKITSTPHFPPLRHFGEPANSTRLILRVSHLLLHLSTANLPHSTKLRELRGLRVRHSPPPVYKCYSGPVSELNSLILPPSHNLPVSAFIRPDPTQTPGALQVRQMLLHRLPRNPQRLRHFALGCRPVLRQKSDNPIGGFLTTFF